MTIGEKQPAARRARRSRPPPAGRSRSLREIAGDLHRELRIICTRYVRPERWVFVVGCYNSGTELLVRMLGAHPDITALPVEGQFLTDQFPADYELGLPRMWAAREHLFRLTESDAGPDAGRLKQEWAMRLDRSRPVFLEKSPPNAARTRWLQANFEHAHFVAIVRNGFAVAEGIRRKAEPTHRPRGWPIALCARQWRRSNEILLEDARHLDHVLWVRYEDLTARPAAELRRILEFLGRDDLDAIDLDSRWSVHEREEPIRDLNAESIGRLTPSERRIISEEAAPMLDRFGYGRSAG